MRRVFVPTLHALRASLRLGLQLSYPALYNYICGQLIDVTVVSRAAHETQRRRATPRDATLTRRRFNGRD